MSLSSQTLQRNFLTVLLSIVYFWQWWKEIILKTLVLLQTWKYIMTFLSDGSSLKLISKYLALSEMLTGIIARRRIVKLYLSCKFFKSEFLPYKQKIRTMLKYFLFFFLIIWPVCHRVAVEAPVIRDISSIFSFTSNVYEEKKDEFNFLLEVWNTERNRVMKKFSEV